MCIYINIPGSNHELHETPFLEWVVRALRSGGVLCIQAESVWFKSLDLQDLLSKYRQIFNGSAAYAWTIVPSYPRHVFPNIFFSLCH